MSRLLSIGAIRSRLDGRRRPKRIPRQPEGRTVAIEYASTLRRRVITPLLAAIERVLVVQLPGLESIARMTPGVAIDEMRADVVAEVETAIDRINRIFEEEVRAAVIADIARQSGQRMANVNARGFIRQMKAIGIDLFADAPDLADAIRIFAAENVRLITRMKDEHLERVKTITVGGFRTGLRHEAIAPQIREAAGIPKRRAALIARDQIATLNGQLTRSRQLAAGIQKARWRTSGDARVRDEHAALEGQEYDVREGVPGVGFPGGPIQCRCTSEPILPDFNQLDR